VLFLFTLSKNTRAPPPWAKANETRPKMAESSVLEYIAGYRKDVKRRMLKKHQARLTPGLKSWAEAPVYAFALFLGWTGGPGHGRCHIITKIVRNHQEKKA
jgi:hypothetical protein